MASIEFYSIANRREVNLTVTHQTNILNATVSRNKITVYLQTELRNNVINVQEIVVKVWEGGEFVEYVAIPKSPTIPAHSRVVEGKIIKEFILAQTLD